MRTPASLSADFFCIFVRTEENSANFWELLHTLGDTRT